MPLLLGVSFYSISGVLELSWLNILNFFFDNPIYLPIMFLLCKTAIKTCILLSLNNKFWQIFSPMLQSFGTDISFICVSLIGGLLINFQDVSEYLPINRSELLIIFSLLICIYILLFFIYKLQERMGNRRDSIVYIFHYEMKGIKWKNRIRALYIFLTYFIGYLCYINVLCLYKNS